MQTQPRTAFKQWKMIILFSLLRQEYLTDDYLLLPLKTPFLQDDKCEFPKAGKCFLGKKKKPFPEIVPIILFINILATCWLYIVHFSHICPQRIIKAVVTPLMCKETVMWIKSRRRKKKDGGHLQNSSRNLNLLVLIHSVSRYIFPWDKISETHKAISWYFYKKFLFWKSGNIMMRLNLPSLYFI